MRVLFCILFFFSIYCIKAQTVFTNDTASIHSHSFYKYLTLNEDGTCQKTFGGYYIPSYTSYGTWKKKGKNLILTFTESSVLTSQKRTKLESPVVEKYVLNHECYSLADKPEEYFCPKKN